jgi:hypothetical protein
MLKARSTLVLAFALAAVVMAGSARASAVFTETIITGDASILNPTATAAYNSLVVANNVGFAASAVTVNGVDFGNDGSGFTNFSSTTADFSTDPFSPALNALLDPLLFVSNTNPATLALSGLEIGRNYVLQLLFSNDQNITGNNVDITIDGTTHRLDDWQTDAINLTAEFTASSSTVLVTFSAPLDGQTGSARRAIVNAYALHLLPEPGAMAIFVLGLAGLAFARRRLAA